MQRVLNMATVESDNPDLRDRGYIYWRLLCANADVAKAVRPTCRIARCKPHNSSQLAYNRLALLACCDAM